MALNRNTTRPKGVPGVKALVTTASLAVTLAGWATLSAHTPAPVALAIAPAEVEQVPVVVMAPPPAWLRESPNIPAIPEVATVKQAGAEPVLSARPRPVVRPHPAAAPVPLRHA